MTSGARLLKYCDDLDGTERPAEGEDDITADIRAAIDEIERLQSICAAIASGLRGRHATRDDMAKLADSAVPINT